ncbi:hypothetical protein GGX14DRAFT_667757 [Mycena pura]|uniref:Uncharacterized protein n=1 Tax=Mycena pura TaxID=153505 RepID=A0AAD6Y297_9AGAR|nr:hypothetical protein GGX14DRAFT_667757 [Mycena pura]
MRVGVCVLPRAGVLLRTLLRAVVRLRSVDVIASDTPRSQPLTIRRHAQLLVPASGTANNIIPNTQNGFRPTCKRHHMLQVGVFKKGLWRLRIVALQPRGLRLTLNVGETDVKGGKETSTVHEGGICALNNVSVVSVVGLSCEYGKDATVPVGQGSRISERHIWDCFHISPWAAGRSGMALRLVEMGCPRGMLHTCGAARLVSVENDFGVALGLAAPLDGLERYGSDAYVDSGKCECDGSKRDTVRGQGSAGVGRIVWRCDELGAEYNVKLPANCNRVLDGHRRRGRDNGGKKALAVRPREWIWRLNELWTLTGARQGREGLGQNLKERLDRDGGEPLLRGNVSCGRGANRALRRPGELRGQSEKHLSAAQIGELARRKRGRGTSRTSLRARRGSLERPPGLYRHVSPMNRRIANTGLHSDEGETETARVGQKLGIGQKNFCETEVWRAHLTVILKAMGQERYGVKREQRPKKLDEQRRTERIWRKELTETNEWNRFSAIQRRRTGEWWVIAASTVTEKRPLYAEMHP